MKFFQKEIKLNPFNRGFHLITSSIENAISEIKQIKVGQLQVFIKHTSASLTINENADSTVRTDFESHFNKMIPENAPYFLHTYEGPDDMPAHIKASILGPSIQIPITNGRKVYICVNIEIMVDHENLFLQHLESKGIKNSVLNTTNPTRYNFIN